MREASTDRRVRVLHVIDGLGHGGAETVMLNELRLIDPDRFAMFVVSTSDDHHPAVLARARANAESAQIISGRAMWDARPAASIARLIRREHIDVVHTHLEGADVVGGAAAWCARRPVVSTLHIVHEWRDNLRKRRRSLADFANRRFAQRFIAVSEGVKESHVRRLGLDPRSIDVLPNVSLADRTLPTHFDIAATRRELGVPHGTVLCAVANLIENKKDIPTLIRALPLVRERTDEPFTLLVVGDGPQRAQLTELAHHLGVADAVRFLGYRDDATQIMASSDMLCHATLFEGMPMVVLEAMTLGVPIVATRAQGITDLLDDDRSGLLVAPRDPAAFADAIVRLLVSPGLRADLARNATQTIAQHYNSDAWIERIEGIYSALAR
jgi:glycosyltransferase involved in cell wall biosynthesis